MGPPNLFLLSHPLEDPGLNESRIYIYIKRTFKDRFDPEIGDEFEDALESKRLVGVSH